MKRVIQIHVPRTAGSSMKVWARKKIPSFQGSTVIRTFIREWNPSAMWTYMAHNDLGSLVRRGITTQEWYDSCFKFAFVRNTWDWLVSLYEWHYHYKIKKRKEISFYDYVQSVISGQVYERSQISYLVDGMNFVGRYESLEEDWKKLCVLVGINYSPLVERYHETHHTDFRSYYTTKLKQAVGNHFQDDIERYGFVFG